MEDDSLTGTLLGKRDSKQQRYTKESPLLVFNMGGEHAARNENGL